MIYFKFELIIDRFLDFSFGVTLATIIVTPAVAYGFAANCALGAVLFAKLYMDGVMQKAILGYVVTNVVAIVYLLANIPKSQHSKEH